MRAELDNLRATQLDIQQTLLDNSQSNSQSGGFSARRAQCEPDYLLEPTAVVMGREHDSFIKLLIDTFYPPIGGCGNRGEFYVVDVGVNTGAITLKAAQHGARVIGFEAIPSNHQLVTHRIWLNDFDREDQVVVFNMAAAAADNQILNFAEGYYERPKHNQGGENHEDVQYTQKDKPSPDVIWQKDGHFASEEDATSRDDIVQVPANTIDTIIKREIPESAEILLFKMDVEGFENSVALGATELFGKQRPKVIHTEFCADCVGKEFLPRFLDWGYRIFIEDCSHNIDDQARSEMYTMGLRCVSQDGEFRELFRACKQDKTQNHKIDTTHTTDTTIENYQVTHKNVAHLHKFLVGHNAMLNLVMC